MPAHRTTMRKTREILRLRWGKRLAGRQVARSCRISPSTVGDCVARAKAAGLSWPLPEDLDDAALEELLYPPQQGRPERPLPDFPKVYRELKHKGVTQELLWLEYKAQHPDDGYQYSQFCALYRAWRTELDVVMRQEHIAGEKLFVDYAGLKMELVDPKTGEVRKVPIFVAALGASNYTYAEAQEAEDLRSWIAGHIRAFEFYGGVTTVTVPDNLKVGVTKACFYEPDINPTYLELAKHYDTVILPTRVRKPRDKAKVENAVLQVERWVIAPLRKQTFFSLDEINDAIQQRLEWLNNRPLSRLEGTRRSLFEEMDRPALKPLPRRRFETPEWKPDVGVNIDYHIEFDRHYYSVPYQLTGKRVDVRATATIVECLYKGKRVASHVRSYRKGGFTTDPAHRPKSHQRMKWPPSRLVRMASVIGPNTEAMVKEVLERKKHPEQGYRACMGVLRLGKRFGRDRLEAACARAITIQAYTYRSIESILKTGLDAQPLEQPQQTELALDHENIRGPGYYTRRGEQS